MSRNVTIRLECQAMCFDNCVVHYALGMDMTAPKKFAWRSQWQWHWFYLVMPWVIEWCRMISTFQWDNASTCNHGSYLVGHGYGTRYYQAYCSYISYHAITYSWVISILAIFQGTLWIWYLDLIVFHYLYGHTTFFIFTWHFCSNG